jgi:hypothetical protein
MSCVQNVASIKMAPLWPYDSMDSHWVGVWIPMVNGTWPCWFHQHFGKRTHFLDVGECKIELKLQGWCVNVNSLSYVSNPNVQCLEAEWNHFMSYFDPHSHVPTKLFYACHIFVWSCNLCLVGPICGPSMLVTCLEHNETYKKWILGHVHHVQMTHQFVHGPYEKSWF